MVNHVITNYSRFIIISLILISVVGTAAYLSRAYMRSGDTSSDPTVVIEFTPMIGGKPGILGNDLVISVLVTAPLPPSIILESGRDTAVVYSGTVREGVVIKRGVMEPLINGWMNDYAKRGSPKAPYIGLTISINLVNVTEGKVVGSGIDSITIDPERLSKGMVAIYTLTLGLSSPSDKMKQIISVGLSDVRYVDKYSAFILLSNLGEEVLTTSTPVQGTSGSLANYEWCNPVNSVTYVCYTRTYYADADDMAEALPDDYSNNYGGVTYVRTPILIAENDLPGYSATDSVSINIGISDAAIGIYPTYTIGPNIGEALKHPASSTFPSLTLWKGDGIVWGGERYFYGTTLILTTNHNTEWVWIYARPYIEVYSVYLVTVGGGETYLHDEVTTAITDVLISGSSIIGGYENGLPADALLQNFLAGTNETYVTTLAPHESVTLESIFQYYDTCGTDFEIGLPVGALVAAVVSLAAPIASPVAAGIAGFQVSLSAVGASVWISGNIVNQGDLPDVPGDFNVYEGVWMRISKYKYKVDPPWWCFWYSPCYYDVPAGIYFKLV